MRFIYLTALERSKAFKDSCTSNDAVEANTLQCMSGHERQNMFRKRVSVADMKTFVEIRQKRLGEKKFVKIV